MKNTRYVSILTGPAAFLDHLGTLSILLEIPLIVTDQNTLEQAHIFYPQLNVKLFDMHELSLDYLSDSFDIIFGTTLSWATTFQPLFELFHQKTMRFVYCPHGNSDKKSSRVHHYTQDIYLAYGDHYSDLLHNTGAVKSIRHLITTGNYRLPFYRKHQAFYDALAHEKIFSHFTKRKPLLLYAPSWETETHENPSSFFCETDRLIEQLAKDFNLIIKLHPNLTALYPERVLQISGRHQTQESVLFLEDFPPIYPLLARCDLYIGDFSSIGYDFLAFDKPLYFFNSLPTAPYLHRCGIPIPENQKHRLNEFIKETYAHAQEHYSTERKQAYKYAFGEEKAPQELRVEIEKKITE